MMDQVAGVKFPGWIFLLLTKCHQLFPLLGEFNGLLFRLTPGTVTHGLDECVQRGLIVGEQVAQKGVFHSEGVSRGKEQKEPEEQPW